MDGEHWRPSPAVASSLEPTDSPAVLLTTTTIDALSYQPSAKERALHKHQLRATGRRSWKTLKGKSHETVWPPRLEAALLEALEKYQEQEWQPALNRFPLRNRFVSEHIYETTGKHRTPKQVGSRLQQLKDTCKEVRLLKLIAPHLAQDSAETARMSSEHPETTRDTTDERTNYPSPTIHVDIIIDKGPLPSSAPTIYLEQPDNAPPLQIRMTSYRPQHAVASLSSACPSNLSGMSPAILIHSPCPLLQQSMVSVYSDGNEMPLHSEVASLSCSSWPLGDSCWVYATSLVPGIWDHLSSYSDLTHLCIEQRIIPLRPLKRTESQDPHDWPVDPTITIFYRFPPSQIISFDSPIVAPVPRLSSSYSSTQVYYDQNLPFQYQEYTGHSDTQYWADSNLETQPNHLHQNGTSFNYIPEVAPQMGDPPKHALYQIWHAPY
ncbi:hypothetical protein Hypma_006772 [Hypsizygus marmoreus]|uniref:TEA domain-containing protein n=1 Tax=Hypsizygus marmoreus TaxID=39966 RepID=A0A369JYN9_HYPMA|nr:hypothetical protein Hypma_006772 [Hypsizygus marmoreus]